MANTATTAQDMSNGTAKQAKRTAPASPTTTRRDSGLSLGFRSLETEIHDAVELDVRGAMPKDLEGTLYRIGPARHDVYGDRLRSWFDGDGMAHALDVTSGRVTYRNRFVATPGKLEEDRAQRRLYRSFATRGPGSLFARFKRRYDRKNPGNTNIVFHAGKLLALCEGGFPYALDATTLQTLREDDLGGVLAPGETFSAHPKLDRETGEMWNFGISHGRTATLNVFCTTAEGETARTAAIKLPEAAMIHDFALTATKVIFVIPPIVLPRVPLSLALGQASYAESLRWRPELGVRIAILDRATGCLTSITNSH